MRMILHGSPLTGYFGAASFYHTTGTDLNFLSLFSARFQSNRKQS
jgi:hypothetical protein